jgi:biofilm PGA synthesis N-glycosyltransferase PgaC
MRPVEFSVNDLLNKKRFKILYWPLRWKFWTAQTIAFVWLGVSIFIAIGWVWAVGRAFGGLAIEELLAFILISGVAFLPGYTNAFYMSSLLLDRQKAFKEEYPTDEVSILVAAYN